ncbi:MAG TPA: efflux RND transporter permease subunit [Vicinamibacterales bacterium]|nr:efflux RND transporter permease subunit [Vicinamibacterales bacterium]
MNFATLFVRRPVATTLIQLAIILFGIMGYRALPVSDLPTIDYPTISVNASLPGANPDTMAAAVATPLEKQFSTIPGVTQITSSSSLGSTSITLQFDLDRSIDAAAQDVQTAISRSTRQLPPGMPSPPSYNKVNPADQPIFYLALSSPTLPLSLVDEYAETVLAQRISMVDGVAQVNVFGAQKFAVRIDLDPMQLASRQIGVDQIASAIQTGTASRPTGTLYGADKNFTVFAQNGQLFSAKEFGPLIVAYSGGRPVRLDEVAHVYDGVENDKTASWVGDTRAIYLSVQRQPGTNTVAVVDAIKDLLPRLQAQLPASVQVGIRADRSKSIRESVHDVKFTLLLTVALVIMVIFLFLRNLSATLIPSLALPASVVGTFAAMYLLGYSLDNLSLMALTLSVGFVVDDAIVMLENCVRHMELGETAMEAALKGAKEIAFTIVSMTLSLVAVFIPVLFMGGIVGRLLHEFAVTISVAILVSGFVSVSLTPMLCARWLRPDTHLRHGRAYMAIEQVFEWGRRSYGRTLRATLKYRPVTLMLSVVLLGVTAYLFVVIPKGFIPSVDTGNISATTDFAQGIGFDAMVAHQKQIAEIVKADPNVLMYTSNVGTGPGGGGGSQGRFSIDLKPLGERKLTADQVIDELRRKVSGVPGVRVFLQNPPAIRIGGQMTRSLYQYTLQTNDTAALYEFAPKLEAAMRTLPGLVDVSSDLQLANPQVNISLDRDRIGALGLTVDQVESAMANAYSNVQVSTIYAPTNEYMVLMRMAPQYQDRPDMLSLLYIRSAAGALVPLSAVASFAPGVGPQLVNHTGQMPSVTLSFNLSPGVSLGAATTAVQNLSREMLPASIIGSFQGTAQAFQDSITGLGVILIMAIFVIYVVLGILYESFIHPLTILSGLPSAGLGALVTLLVFHVELNLYAFVGVIMLVGLVKKNGIMMIDFAIEAQRTGGLSAHDAIYEACMVRFRPIMMTTMAALVGTVPIAMGLGAGAESRQPLGLAVVGGLIVSQTLTLYITPVFYLYMEGFAARLTRRRRRPVPVAAKANVA